MDYIVWLLGALAFFVLVGAIIVLTIGIVWSPVGALLCGIAARKRGLSTARYAIAGAFYSALFILPWIYFTLRLLNRKAPNDLVYLGYIIIYAAWVLCPIFIYFAMAYIFFTHTSRFDGLLFELRVFDYLLAWGASIYVVFNILVLLKSIHDLKHPHSRLNLADDEEQKSRENLLLERRYILPFVYPILLATVFFVFINIPGLIDMF